MCYIFHVFPGMSYIKSFFHLFPGTKPIPFRCSVYLIRSTKTTEYQLIIQFKLKHLKYVTYINSFVLCRNFALNNYQFHYTVVFPHNSTPWSKRGCSRWHKVLALILAHFSTSIYLRWGEPGRITKKYHISVLPPKPSHVYYLVRLV